LIVSLPRRWSDCRITEREVSSANPKPLHCRAL
jgi:hypothetical protein